jgi:hypothetical protein
MLPEGSYVDTGISVYKYFHAEGNLILKIRSLAGSWWLTPIILATWEAEIRRNAVPYQLREK